MKIAQLFDFNLEEARRNNFGREVSNAQGQNLGKQLAAGDPNAQAALAQAKAAKATNTTDAGGDALGQTTPAQRLAAQKAAKAAAPATTAPAAQAQAATPAATPDAATSARIAAAPQGYDPETGQPIGQQAAPAGTGDPTLDAPLPGTPAAAGPKKTFAQKVGGLAKGVGAVGGGIAGIGRAIKKGYAAGADAVGGPGQVAGSAPANGATTGGAAAGGAPAGGGGGGASMNINSINSRLTAVEKAVGIAENVKFHSKFLGIDI
jgi:hypothetical protein